MPANLKDQTKWFPVSPALKYWDRIAEKSSRGQAGLGLGGGLGLLPSSGRRFVGLSECEERKPAVAREGEGAAEAEEGTSGMAPV